MLIQHIVARIELTDQRLDRRFEQFTTVDAATDALVSEIGREFARGYNDTLHSFDPSAVRAYVEARPTTT